MTFRYPRPEVLRELPKGHAVIEASAGTGKTFTLEHLVVDLLLSAVPIARILVVTFTEKAANELRSRVRALVERLLEAREDDRVAPEVGDERCWVIDAAARGRLEAALREYDSASISTIHAFCQKVLVENAFANHRLFEEELVDGRELFAQAFRDVLRARFATDTELKEYLTLWREEGSIEGLEALLWECLARRGRIVPEYDRAELVRLADSLGRRAEALALVPLAHKRTRDNLHASLEAVFDALESFEADETFLGSYHKLLGVYDETATHTCPAALNYAVQSLTRPAAKSQAVAALHQKLTALAAAIPLKQALVAARFLPLVNDRLASLKRERGRFDYQDMLSLVDEALSGPRGPRLLTVLRERFSCALIDEFQDTDEVQWSVFKKVFFESKDHRLYLVGDPKQAIYAFRGADVQTYLAARDAVVQGGQPVVLARNFRSTAGLIDALNRIFTAGFFSGGIDYAQPVTCGRPENAFVDPKGLAPVHVLVTDNDKSSGKRAVFSRLGPAIAREIRRLTEPEEPATWNGKKVEYREIYVLARSGGDLAIIAEQLREAGIPFAFYKQEGLFQEKEAQAIEDVLAAVADPTDRAKRFRAWMTPFFGLRLSELTAAGEVGEDHPLMRRLRDWHRLSSLRRHERLFAALLEDSGLVRRLVLFEPGERALTNYLHVLEILREQYVVRGASTEEMVQGLRAFRQRRRLPAGQNANLQRLETERDAVQLLTMHMSKGLEAPVVFVVGGYHKPNFTDGVRTLHWPAVGQGGARERLTLIGGVPRQLSEQAAAEESQEDQRLLYVALTRAKGRLYLPFAGRSGTFKCAELDGPYRRVNDRLAPILTVLAQGGADAGFSYEVLSRPSAGFWGEEEQAPPIVVPDRILQAPPPEDLGPLRRGHAGFTTTSFTSLRDRLEGPAAEVKAETRDAIDPPEDELPAGPATGSFLHELLARIPPEVAMRAASPEQLSTTREAQRLAAHWARRYGVARDHWPHAFRLVHTALRAPIALGEGRRLEGIASARPLLREMDFLYPLPEEGHLRLDQLPKDEGGRPFEIGRGFVTGFVDVLFEHQGRAYFADWKSNCLASFDRAAVDAEVTQIYELQGRLYTLALVKMLGVHDEKSFEARFGGFLFLFLRGLGRDGTGEGVHFRRPSWRNVLSWEKDLLQLRFDEGAA